MSLDAPWPSPEYADALSRWVASQVGDVRLEHHKTRPWSTVWTARAGERTWWAKQGCVANRFEAGLVAVLGQVVPDRVVPLVAADVPRGLMLMPDLGSPMGFGGGDLRTWAGIVQGWAQVQRALVAARSDLAAVGVPELPVASLPERVGERVELMRGFPVGDPRHLSVLDAARIAAAAPELARDVAAVVALGLPSTLDHNDLHGGNVFARADGYCYFDLGDSVLTDPAAVLLVPLEAVQRLLGCGPDDRRLLQVADAWVEVWSDLAPSNALRAALPHSLRLARFARHEAWMRITHGLSEAELVAFAPDPAETIAALPDPPLLSPVPGPPAGPAGGA